MFCLSDFCIGLPELASTEFTLDGTVSPEPEEIFDRRCIFTGALPIAVLDALDIT